MLQYAQLFTLFEVNHRQKKNNKAFIVNPVMKHYFVNPCNQMLLDAAAYGDLNQVKAILKDNPGLLTFRGNVIDPAGNTIKWVTAYEYALGAADDEMADIIRESFDKFPGGNEARIEQEANYKDAIDNMLKQPDFDFSALLKVIIEAPPQDVTEALNLNFNHQSPLQDALEEFRKYFIPRVIKNGEMHFNYANLLKIFDLDKEQFKNLNEASKNTLDKRDLFWQQIMGYLQRGLPACGRQLFAGNIGEEKQLNRSFNFKYSVGAFPITSGDLSRLGLGYEYSACLAKSLSGWSAAVMTFFKIYFKKKHQTCKTYVALPIRKFSVSNFLN